MKWHASHIDTIFRTLKTNSSGLTHASAKSRTHEHGFNEIITETGKSTFQILLHQFTDFMILVLLAAAAISAAAGDVVDAIVIMIIVLLNALLGFIQEYRAEKAIQALRKMAAPYAIALREGTFCTVPASQLVPGDIVSLEAGNVVPADMRVMESNLLRADEASLTGESFPIDKHIHQLQDESLPLADRTNMVYKGTFITYGRGLGIVVATGLKTELGKIATLIQQDASKSPLQKRLADFGKKLSYIIFIICIIIFVIGWLQGVSALLMLLTVISLAVAAIPESLPAVITISLAIGAKRMVKKNALIRKLSAVETLGSVTYICSDKTGTLTHNKMITEVLVCKNEIMQLQNPLQIKTEEDFNLLLTAMALNNDVQRGGNTDLLGDPTEVALYTAAKENGFIKEEIQNRFPRVAELPFDSVRKCMTTIHRYNSGYMAITKGAVEELLRLTKTDGQTYKEHAEKIANDGLRVIAFSVKYFDLLPSDISPSSIEHDLEIIGLAGIVDPPRQEAREAIALCKTAGIKPVMITGDHLLTAKNVATRLGILSSQEDIAISGNDLSDLSEDEFQAQVEHIKVYARVSPEQKLKIVKALQNKGQFVAMTGDGVNDAPTLKRADIGIAMGITGTDVAKESSHMILLDDNFATIVKAIKQGRRIYDNIRRFIKYALTCNSAEILTILMAPLIGLPIPLLPIHILWINLVTDGLPGIALAAEPSERNIMQRPPRPPKESIFSGGLGVHIIWVGLLMALVTVITQMISLRLHNIHWQTMVFTVLSFSQMGHVLAIRSEKQSLFSQGLFSNLPLLGAVILTVVLQLSTLYIPIMNEIFKTQPLTMNELLLAICLSSIVFIAVEIEKFIKSQINKDQNLELQ